MYICPDKDDSKNSNRQCSGGDATALTITNMPKLHSIGDGNYPESSGNPGPLWARVRISGQAYSFNQGARVPELSLNVGRSFQ